MAIIKCPSCGSDVSEKASECPHCHAKLDHGTLVADEPKSQVCSECGATIPQGAATCPNCGAPVEADANKSIDATGQTPDGTAVAPSPADAAGTSPEGEKPIAPPEVTSPDAKSKARKKPLSKKMKIVIAAIVAAVVVIGGISWYSYSQQQAKLKAQERAVAAYNAYVLTLKMARQNMVSGAASAETLANTTSKVWNAAIFKKNQSDWDSDISAYYSTDFNESLKMLFSDSGTAKTVSDIKSNQSTVSDEMRVLSSVPDSSLQNAYSEAKDMYDSYLSLTNLAISPTGSLQTFNSNFNTYDSAVSNAYEKLGTAIPDTK